MHCENNMMAANGSPSMDLDVYNLIDSRISTINFELANYDSVFIRKDIPRHIKAQFKSTFFNEKKKELEFLQQMIDLIEDETDEA
jgi:hypothetical protein